MSNKSRLTVLLSFLLSSSFALSSFALANDGRNRYEGSTPSLLEHLPGPVTEGAGFRVLLEDKPGGADGDSAFRWALPHALALVEVAARHTEQEFGPGKFEMALFDFCAENADTPISFSFMRPTRYGRRMSPPDGRHPGGSHDGGLNLDLGYYLTSLKGKFLAEDYAACTEHYEPDASKENFEAKDVHRCLGPADRLDVAREAYFVLEILKINRESFGMGLVDMGGMDAKVQKALMAKLQDWKKQAKYSVTDELMEDLRRLFSHDPWDGWAGYHHHHLHLRLLPSSASGPYLLPAQKLVRQARDIRAKLWFDKHPKQAAFIDARLLSYSLHRSIQLHLITSKAACGNLLHVRYRMDGKQWMDPHDAKDQQRLTVDIPDGSFARESKMQLEAQLVFKDSGSRVLKTTLVMPGQDPRLQASYQPGSIQGSVRFKKKRMTASIHMPDALKPLVTSVRYLVYPKENGAPLCLEVKSAWFESPKNEKGAGSCKVMPRSKDTRFALRFRLPRQFSNPFLVKAQVIFSKRLKESIPIYVGFPYRTDGSVQAGVMPAGAKLPR